MNPSIYQADLTEVKSFILSKLSSALNNEQLAELNYSIDELRDKQQATAYYMAFSKVVRAFGKEKLSYTDEQLTHAQAIRKDWSPPSSVDKAIRLLILLEIPHSNEKNYLNTLQNLFDAGDVGELVALYAALPVLPYPEKFILRCMEGVRTNMGEVFESVANLNPYPADYLSEDAFNQLVLKCLFIGKPLYKIVNLTHRLNKSLANMAKDYAHERWAASRELSPELWQLLAPYLEAVDLNDIKRLIWSGNDLERAAAELVCSVSPIAEAKELYAASNYKSKIESGELNWHTLGIDAWNNS